MKISPKNKPSPRGRSVRPKSGSLTPAETQPLIMAAREAYRRQDPDLPFNDWRHEQVMIAVGLPGFTACRSENFCDLMGHFKTLAGQEDQAMYWYCRSKGNHARRLAWSIMNRLDRHQWLATASSDDLCRSTSPRRIQALMDRQAALLDHSEGPIGPDYLRTIIRAVTVRPSLVIDDLHTFLTTNLDVADLIRVRNTLVNRISEREGVGLTSNRNKSQNSPESKARRASRADHDLFSR